MDPCRILSLSSLKTRIALTGIPMTELRDVTCHYWDHTVTYDVVRNRDQILIFLGRQYFRKRPQISDPILYIRWPVEHVKFGDNRLSDIGSEKKAKNKKHFSMVCAIDDPAIIRVKQTCWFWPSIIVTDGCLQTSEQLLKTHLFSLSFN